MVWHMTHSPSSKNTRACPATLGEQKSDEFHARHKINDQSEKASWFGKTFKSAACILSLVCVDAGNKDNNAGTLEALIGSMNGKDILDSS
ncbi:hypothetical protein JK2ML_0121 [Mycobacterium leprae Kyoto-2]|uniref:GXWXG domain-containing protein n=4 Tax=Mycobacterium leprae TaxID=1769 RepID=Q9CD93_MYCLE|nr:GXWXG domain-containing protein [Mycobacterium leprae]OAR21008.1 hypothetical protein A8144_08255 [Mycobacterium leprae 3125609]CAR70214.1 hypothetical protein MLBr00121 [Mycobacterium leprae Br4923]AWV47117.1 hypothetical protein DIJ64_00630 [Mycobacterium leprae]OAX71155.1 hypothetical protein A3216_07630 [Mycobacterium leprae 7935681]CAC29629.1 hypothetical protein [Mycobacterium leprae]